MKKLIIILFLITTPAFASMQKKCGKTLSQRYIKISNKLSDFRATRKVPKSLGSSLNSYLAISTSTIYANTSLQTDQGKRMKYILL